ncbi:PepSY-associated TM helix domain-containing protein [Pseudohongiella sp. SYSU M77423]|uniref:PepSY-associated TM helix domain-containing protein n=1 Tax=Pseudohongiella sp. SYSU M77423 TaxID=3042312 RepID=UPI00247FF135|nr:PepSY-associated TM helix domain-containing protein [Pseudohongiella sp. SYSU M77423]MDH7942945.1 PepSY-associated TM helix domain-containing protein [Pseudohongiella sp. SYSU M77423]
MRLLRKLHLYSGLLLSLALFLIAISGAALLYKNEYWALRYTQINSQDVSPSASEQAAAIAQAYALYGTDLGSLKMPEPDLAAYHVYLPDHEEALLDTENHAVVDEWQPRQRLMGLLFDIHAHLMAGDRGEIVAGIIGLIGGLMAITGMILWWPTRRAFRWQQLWPTDTSRASLLAWHRDAGMLLSPLLLLFILSGSAMVFYTSVQKGMNAMFGDPVPTIELPPGTPVDIADPARPLPSADTIMRVQQALPDARLMFYYADALPQGFHRFRLKRSCELHPNGLSFVYTDARSGEIVAVKDACAMPPGERLTNMIYPLHAGKTGSELYRTSGLLTALVLAGLAATGVVTYAQRIMRRGRRRTAYAARGA